MFCFRNHSTDATCAIHEENLQNYQNAVLDKQSKSSFNSEQYCGNITLNVDDFEKYLQLPCRGDFPDCNTGKISKDDIEALFKRDIQNVQTNKRSFSDPTSSNEHPAKRFVFRQSNAGSNDLASSRTSRQVDRLESNVNDRLFDSCHSNRNGRNVTGRKVFASPIYEADMNKPLDRFAKFHDPVLAPPNIHQQNEQNIRPSSWTVTPNEPSDATRNKNAFITAGEELHRRTLLKNGQNPNQASTTPLFAYGKSTKTLGMGPRRSVHSKFVPPVSSSTHAQPNENCTSDSDVDPRLKSIEPKMIELIQNEIMHQTSAVGKFCFKKNWKFFNFRNGLLLCPVLSRILSSFPNKNLRI